MRHTFITAILAAAAFTFLAATLTEAGTCMQCKPTIKVTGVPMSDATEFLGKVDQEITGGSSHWVDKPPQFIGTDGMERPMWNVTLQYWRMCKVTPPLSQYIKLDGADYSKWSNAEAYITADKCGKRVDCHSGTHCEFAW